MRDRSAERSRTRRGLSSRSCRVPWYVDAFNGDYLSRYSHRSDAAAAAEIPFVFSSLKLSRGARVLDLCCGAGRHSRALAGRGLNVLGIDLSQDLLRAAKRITIARTQVCYCRGDMRKLPLRAACMEGAVNLFTSFGYFESERENFRVLTEASRVLKSGARFVMDFFNSRKTIAELVPHSCREINGQIIEERRSFLKSSGRLAKTIRIRQGSNVCVRKESVRAYSPAELAALLRRAGFRVLGRYGDLQGSAFNSRTSPRCVLVCEKRKA